MCPETGSRAHAWAVGTVAARSEEHRFTSPSRDKSMSSRAFETRRNLARPLHSSMSVEAFAMSEMRSLNEVSEVRPQFAGKNADSFFQIEAWMPSEIKAVGSLVQRLMRLIEGSHCVSGDEPAVALALQEALNNAVVHGNRMDPEKPVQVLCHCDGRGISLVVKDRGQGFDPNTVPNPPSPENLIADHGRGIWLMRAAMDEVSFANRGTEVHMRKHRHTTQERSRRRSVRLCLL
jgi:serine/threonine-protein kinase RsbW